MQIYDAYRGTLVFNTSVSEDFKDTQSANFSNSMVLLKAKGELAQLTDIPPEEQVLITSNGEYLSQFKEDEKTIGQISEVFLFDRRIMKSKIDLPCLEFEITEIEPLESDESISSLGPLSSVPSEIILSFAHLLANASTEHFEKSCQVINEMEIFLWSLEALSLFFHKFKETCLDMNNLLLKNLNNLQNELNDSLKTFKATKELSKRIPVALKLYDEKTPCNTLADYFDLKSLEVDKENCQILKGTLKEDMSKLTKEMTNLNISLKKDIMENIRLGLDDRRLQLEDAEKLVSTLEILLSDVEADLKERVSITKRSLLKNNSVKVLAETERKLKNLLLDCLKARENALGKFHQEIKFIDQMESSMRNNTNFLRETFLKFFKVDSADYSNAEHPIFLKDQLYFHLFDFLRNIQIFNQFPQNYIIGLLEIIRRDLFSNLFSAKISFLFEKGPSQLLEMEMKQRERFQNVAILFPSSFLPSLVEDDSNNLPDCIHLPSDINFSEVIPGKRHMITLETMKEYREAITSIKCSKIEEQMILKKLQGTLDKIFGYFERMSKDMNSILTQALLKAPERLKSSNESRLQSDTRGTSPITEVFSRRNSSSVITSRKTSSDGNSRRTSSSSIPTPISDLTKAYYEEKIRNLEYLLRKSYYNEAEEKSCRHHEKISQDHFEDHVSISSGEDDGKEERIGQTIEAIRALKTDSGISPENDSDRRVNNDSERSAKIEPLFPEQSLPLEIHNRKQLPATLDTLFPLTPNKSVGTLFSPIRNIDAMEIGTTSADSLSVAILQIQERNDLLESQNKELKLIISGLSDKLSRQNTSGTPLVTTKKSNSNTINKISLMDWKNLKESWKKKLSTDAESTISSASIILDTLSSTNVQDLSVKYNIQSDQIPTLKLAFSQAREKISFKDFQIGSIVLFLPVTSHGVHIWGAFSAAVNEQHLNIFLTESQCSTLGLISRTDKRTEYTWIIGEILEFCPRKDTFDKFQEFLVTLQGEYKFCLIKPLFLS